MKTTKTLLTSLALGLSVSLVSLSLSERATGEEQQVMKVLTEKPVEPTKKIVKSEEEWKKELTPEQFYILRQNGTERAFSEVYKEFKEQGDGVYICAGCNAELFSSKEKFDSRSGWPSFYDASKKENVKLVPDVSGGMVRTEVRCAICDGHLGHVFEGEGFGNPTDERYCINGAVLSFVPEKAAEKADAKGEAEVEAKGESESVEKK